LECTDLYISPRNFWNADYLLSEISKRLEVFDRKVLRKILGAIQNNNCWIRQHNNELMQLYGDLDIV
jgi:hypothetical protein